MLADALLRAVRGEVASVAVFVDAKDHAARRSYEPEGFLHGRPEEPQKANWKETVSRAWLDALKTEPPPQTENHKEALFYWENNPLGGPTIVSFYWADSEPVGNGDWKKLPLQDIT